MTKHVTDQQKCKSWFKRHGATGRVVGIWPGSSIHAERALKHPRWEDYEYARVPEVERNAFNWLGNGLTIAQEQGMKTTGYLDEADIPPVVNPGPRPKSGLNGNSVNGNGIH